MDAETVGILYTIKELTSALRMADWAVFMAHEQCTKTPGLLMYLAELLIEELIFSRVHLNLGLQVREPLLLSLAALQSSDTVEVST